MKKILFISVGDGGSDESLVVLLKGLQNHINNYSCHVVVNKQAERKLIPKLLELNVGFSKFNYEIDMWPKFSFTFMGLVKFLCKLNIRLYLNFFVYYKVLQLCKEGNFDLIHSNSSCFQFGFKVSRKLKIPHVWHFREYQDLDFSLYPLISKRSFYKKVFSPLNLNIAISKDVFLHHNLRLCDKVIYNGIVHEMGTDTIAKADYFLFVGRITENKGALEVLNAFIPIYKKNPSFKLFYVGLISDDFKARIDEIIREFNVIDNVRFFGFVNDCSELMKNASALIMASKNEAFGRVTAEAMINECLVIGKNVGGTKEQFDLGFNELGFEIGVRYNSITELQICMDEVASKKNNYSKIIMGAKLCVNKFYNVYTNSAEIVKVYEKLLK